MNDIRGVVHLAARVHVMREDQSEPLTAFRAANVDGTMRLAHQAAAAGVRRFVFVSSVKVNGESTSPGHAFTETDRPAPQDAYGQSKYEAEMALRQLAIDSGMEVTIVRPPLVYGPGVKANFATLMSAVQRGLPLPLGCIENQRSLIGLDNLVDFLLVCLHHPKAANQTFLISDAQDVSVAELIRSLARACGRPAYLLPVPVWILKSFATFSGRQDVVSRLVADLQVDISKARDVLGWTPPVSLNEGLCRAFQGMDRT
ncbi:nucleoside-diphosphate-sugar epimerase [Rhodoferax saidenbachensis]|uniref:Nucleoside-diphosphate-sugar epimerase n=2 Tax=Rhodoferax saidenbachensis TaxID=1484693 RepID=A0ABU1ZKE0_9BURK|nr:nucleoside-diphosphate-sugar epimerase [Rhodoferax saidenbachensis]